MTKIEETQRERLDIVFVGHVDHGKSTVIGRLLADTGALPQGKLEQIKAYCETNSRPFEYAFLIDALKDERKQNITIDSARVFFTYQNRQYIIIDAPGHVEFVKNMVTGAARADAAILVIDALEGIQENSRRHGYLLWILGVRQVIVVINKMDLVNYRENTYQDVKNEYSEYLNSLGIYAAEYIPVSAREGDNITRDSSNMPWYKSVTLVQALENFQKPPVLDHLPLRMPVQEVFRFTKYGDNRRIISGRVFSGKVAVGEEIIFYPSAKRTTVKSIETFPVNKEKRELSSGDSYGFTVDPQVYIQRGEIASKINEAPPEVGDNIRVSLFWLGKTPMMIDRQYILKIGTTRVNCHIEKIHKIIDNSNNMSLENRDQVGCNEVADCTLKLNRLIAFDISSIFNLTNRFVIVDGYHICGGGIISESIISDREWIQDGVTLRNHKWIHSNISAIQRSEKYDQKPCLIIITGKKNSGRKEAARLLEEMLFNINKQVYYLGIGSILYGIDADLKRKDNPTFHYEHIRRLAEVVHLFLDAGLILILTAIELTQDDLSIIQTVVNNMQIKIIWMGNNVTTDISIDYHILETKTAHNTVVEIIQHLREEDYL
jgi:bifunctional enzyme CysN/CysC